MKILTIGTFDILHYGHINLLQRCALFGDVIVGVNSDAFVKQYKKQAPIMSENERMQTIERLGAEVHLNDGAGRELVLSVMPDVLAIGSDWARKDYLKQINMTQDELDKFGINLLYIPYTYSISTSEIKKRCRQQS